MGLKFRVNLTGFFLVACIALAISGLAVMAIDRMTVSLNQRLLAMELEDNRARIEDSIAVLADNGLSGVQAYVDRAQSDLTTSFGVKGGDMFGALSIVRPSGLVVFHDDAIADPVPECLDNLVRYGAGQMSCLVDGRLRIGAYRYIPEWDWLLMVSVSVEEMHRTRNEFLWRAGAVFLLVSMLGWWLFVGMAQRVVDPILALSTAAATLGQSGWDNLPAPLSRRDEIGELSRNFTAMATRLREAQADLTSQADSLRRANARLRLEIEERSRIEINLRQATAAIEGILDSMPSLVIGVDPECTVTHWNRAARILTGTEPANVVGRPLAYAMPRLNGLVDTVRRAMHDQNPIRLDRVPYEQNGKIHQEDILIFPLVGDVVYGAVIRLDDVTQRVRMEEMLIQSEKMTSLGGLAAGMAHEISSPLAGIGINAFNIKNRIFGDLEKNAVTARECGIPLDRVRAYADRRDIPKLADNIAAAGERAAKIVGNMLKFSRKSESVPAPQDLGQLLDATLDLVANDYDLRKKFDFRRISIGRDYQASMPRVMCEGSEMQQVFFNLFKNGAQAMAAKAFSDEGPVFMIRLREEDGWARIEIEDNGPGMPENVRRRVFEPFFTTKPVGEGTGLGLSVSYFIVTEQHGGTMEVQSAPGLWTKFIIRLPCSDQAATMSYQQ